MTCHVFKFKRFEAFLESSSSSESKNEEPERPVVRRMRFIRDRENPFEILDEHAFKKRFRLNKATVMHLVDIIGDRVAPKTQRNKSLSAQTQMLIALRFYATGGFLELLGDWIHVHKSNICRVIQRVTHEIARLSPHYIKMPRTAEELMATKRKFFRICGFPRVVGAIDCTHVGIQSPGGANAELYRNRKGYFSINVQTICDADLKLLHIISRWPGSVHDSTIFNNSPLPVDFRLGRYVLYVGGIYWAMVDILASSTFSFLFEIQTMQAKRLIIEPISRQETQLKDSLAF
nr:PREDICTED: putative nuclease HARBI1 [Tribolium castaneum]|eukprot:XP_008200958.2 PREDICTED: putative nuclease HARBI1 [Tribolium castaneum]